MDPLQLLPVHGKHDKSHKVNWSHLPLNYGNGSPDARNGCEERLLVHSQHHKSAQIRLGKGQGVQSKERRGAGKVKLEKGH